MLDCQQGCPKSLIERMFLRTQIVEDEDNGNNIRLEVIMFNWAAFFLVFALVAGVFGFWGLAGASAGFAKTLFSVGLVLFVLSLLYGMVTGRRPPSI